MKNLYVISGGSSGGSFTCLCYFVKLTRQTSHPQPRLGFYRVLKRLVMEGVTSLLNYHIYFSL